MARVVSAKNPPRRWFADPATSGGSFRGDAKGFRGRTTSAEPRARPQRPAQASRAFPRRVASRFSKGESRKRSLLP